MLWPTIFTRKLTPRFFYSCVLFFVACIFLNTLKHPLRYISRPVAPSNLKQTSNSGNETQNPLILDNIPQKTFPVIQPVQTIYSSRENFISASIETEIPSFDPFPIQAMCAEGTWPKDLVFECMGASGGLNNVKQQILTCIRWAMEFKAALIVPTIRPRLETNSSENVVHAYAEPKQINMMFDLERFIARMQEACPQLKLYATVSALGKSPKRIKQAGDVSLMASATAEEIVEYKTNWTTANKAEDGKVRVARVVKNANLFQVCNDGTDFGNSFGQVLTLREDAHRLASAVLYELSTRYGLGIDPHTNINSNGFLGIHLRTATDAVKYHFMSYEQQAAIYQQLAMQAALPVAYIASGNRSSIDIFAAAVAPTPVVTKTSLLSGADLEHLDTLTWDQQAQVDYLVLLRASKFLGMSQSTFSWAVALARRAVGQQGTCGVLEKDEGNVTPEMGIALRDELSIIIGKPSKYHFGTRSWP